MTTPAHVLKGLAAACDPDLPAPMPCPLTVAGLRDEPAITLQFGVDETAQVRAWAKLMRLPEPTVQVMPAGSLDPAHLATSAFSIDAPLWAGCKGITVFCPLSTLPEPSVGAEGSAS